MALWDDVAARYSAQRLIELTNGGKSTSATTVDTTRADAAVADVQADFEIYAQQAYDGADSLHVAVATQGVIAKLEAWLRGAGTSADKRYRDWTKKCQDLAAVTSRARVSPGTDIVTTPSVPDTSRGPVRPAFDDEHFRKVRTRPPNTRGSRSIDPSRRSC